MKFTNLQELQNIIIKFSSKEIKNYQELTTTINTTHQEFLNVILKNILVEINVLKEDLTKNANDPLLVTVSQEKEEKLAALYSFQKEIETLQSEINEMTPTTIAIESEKNKINLIFYKIIDHLSQQEIENFKKIFEEDLKVAIKSLGFKIKTIQYGLKFNPNNIPFATPKKSFWSSITPKKIQKMTLLNKQKLGIEIADFDFRDPTLNDDHFSKALKPKQLAAEKRKEYKKPGELNEIDVANKLKITEEKQANQEIEMVTLTTQQKKMQIAKKENGKKLNEITEEIKNEEIEMNEIKNSAPSR
ncbi:hypothetical protein P344_02620 [Spiroplasma mirum ATCC 29335]|uniref:Uncharacterized protein n=1 Tax=Spiroplasma mirum ATCC 29335 TaxID=838561 RepID=W0GL24_9MOLU|nr:MULTISPECIES: hypothetical protein [Spiroplasma]AHF60877.1 hypothetical protein SMM_0437 [Spiroplasma mirum ATCC 29335]AHI57870.1 hypothetical protein P344_02620 [Spiroplasma mirum ATCC 29335]AKM52989.1 hypothetical protein SATRI_v1c04940 [Spiroplasma atrichopogonis]